MTTEAEREMGQRWARILNVDPASPSMYYDIATAVLCAWRDYHHADSGLSDLWTREQIQSAMVHCLKMRNSLRDALPVD